MKKIQKLIDNGEVMDEISVLLERYKEIVNSDRNAVNKEFWSNSQPWYRDMWRGIPKMVYKKPPFIVAPENQFWSYALDFNMADYYHDPMLFLKKQLQIFDFRYTNWQDNTYYEDCFNIWISMVIELSTFGPEIRFFENREPWLSENLPMLNKKETLDKLEPPDFYKSGLMPVVHEFYDRISDKIGSRINVLFPNWARGPFCMASHMRGMENLLMDMITDPDFVHKLMRFVVEGMKKWMLERAKFLKIDKLPRGKLFNDEIGVPMISPKFYEDYILPYEIELSEFQGGIEYWHSCNNITGFYEMVKRIPNLEMVHISPWSDNKKAAQVFGSEIAMDKCINPEDDVLSVERNVMQQKIEKIIEEFGSNARYSIRFDAIEKVHDIDYDLGKINTFVDMYNSL